MTIVQSINLYNQTGNSDKVYNIELRQVTPSSYSVMGFSGRRGSTLVPQNKTASPVEYSKAVKIYDDLVSKKLKDNYSVGGDSTGNTTSSTSNIKSTGLLPQLLNSIDKSELMNYINDDDFMAQEKFDGRRLMVKVSPNHVLGSNKLGLATGVPTTVHNELKQLKIDGITLDGESIGDYYYVWDATNINNVDYSNSSAAIRVAELKKTISDSEYIKVVHTAYSKEEKLALYNNIIDEGGEGVVFKRKSAGYVAGRPSSGGDQIKYKFVETASCIVNKLNDKRSVEISLFNGGQLDIVGNVSIPANKEIPNAGDVIEVQYLYAFKAGSLFQPVYLGKRDDILPEECDVNQLKYKQEFQKAA